MATNATTNGSNPKLSFDSAALPIAQLESLKFKANQILESIQLLQRTIEMGGQNVMPTWPDILSKYNILLSQSHNLSTSLLATHLFGGLQSSSIGSSSNTNPYEKIAVHPSVGMTDAQLDNNLIPLLRNQQTTDVLRFENDVVRHLSEHMASKGSVGILGQSTQSSDQAPPQGTRTEYEDVIRECEQIRAEHDSRVERAVRAVTMLREKYEWKARVEVDQQELEEFDWDTQPQNSLAQNGVHAGGGVDDEMDGTSEGQQSNDSEEEEELEEVLGNGGDQTPDATPHAGPATPMVDG